MTASLKKLPRHVLFFAFIFVSTFSLLHMWLVQYFFFLVYYVALYVFSERNGGRMTPVLRIMEAVLSIYLLGMNMMIFLTGIYFAPVIFYAAVLIVFAWILLMALKKLPVPRFLFLSLFFPFLCFSFIPDPMIQSQLLDDCQRVKNSRGVKPILTFCDKNWIENLTLFLTEENLRRLSNNADSPRAVLVADNPDTVYFSFGRPTYRKPEKPYYTVAKYNRRAGKITGAVPSSSLMHLAYDRKYKRIMGTALDENRVYVIDEKTFKVVKKFRTALHPIDISVDEKSNTIFVLCDYGVELYDLKTFTEKKSFAPNMAPNMFVVSPKYQKVYVCGYATVFMLRAVNLVDGTLTRTRAGWIPPFSLLCSGTALDEKQGILFVSVPLERRMYAYAAGTLERIYRFHVPQGIRDIDYDPQKEKLFAGNYVTGYLEVIDPFSQKVVREIFVGKRIRDIFYSRAAKKVYVASSLGFFEVTP